MSTKETITAKNDSRAFKAGNEFSNYSSSIIEIEFRKPSLRARLMFGYLEKWGLVAAMPDGEDSAGRAKLRLPTTEELVGRSGEIADAAATLAEENGWFDETPEEIINEFLGEEDEASK